MQPTHACANGVEHQAGATYPAKFTRYNKLLVHYTPIINKWNALQFIKIRVGTTNLKLLCLGKRAFLKYWGVSRYRKILIRKAVPLSFSSELFNSVTLWSFTESLLLSKTTTCLFNWIPQSKYQQFRKMHNQLTHNLFFNQTSSIRKMVAARAIWQANWESKKKKIRKKWNNSLFGCREEWGFV